MAIDGGGELEEMSEAQVLREAVDQAVESLLELPHSSTLLELFDMTHALKEALKGHDGDELPVDGPVGDAIAALLALPSEPEWPMGCEALAEFWRSNRGDVEPLEPIEVLYRNHGVSTPEELSALLRRSGERETVFREALEGAISDAKRARQVSNYLAFAVVLLGMGLVIMGLFVGGEFMELLREPVEAGVQEEVSE